jgi:biotin transport system substrate-specific component
MTSTGSLTSSRSLSYIALFAALMAVFGLIPKIDLPFGVPITLQSLGVMLAGCLLGPRRGFLAIGLFLLAVALGLPLLSGGAAAWRCSWGRPRVSCSAGCSAPSPAAC